MCEEELEASLARFGLTRFRPGQREVIEAVLAGRPTVAVLPTGAGKSLCYQLPAVAVGGLTLVVSPLISLMKDQVDALNARAIAATFINSSITAAERDARLQAAARGEVRLLYVAPERFRVPGFIDALRHAPVSLVAVDEAHCTVEWGHDFRPDYARLGEVLRELGPPRRVALTATATPDVRQQIAERLGFVDPAVFVRGFDRPNLCFSVRMVTGDANKLRHCLALLEETAREGGVALVYAATRKNTEQLAAGLSAYGLSAAAYHGGLSDELRTEVQERWMADRLRVVVATNAFGMGVDKRDVRLVIHHALPASAEAYYQEAGRAGRDGGPARCVLLFSHADVRLREFLLQRDGEASSARRRVDLARLRAITGYALSGRCRRAELLAYFGDPDRPGPDQRCGNCDVCLEPPRPARRSTVADSTVRAVLTCVAQLDGWFGRTRIARCLEGAAVREVREAGLERLSSFGVLRGRSHSFVLDLLGELDLAGLVVTEGTAYPKLRLTALGRQVLDGKAQIAVPEPRARSILLPPRPPPPEAADLAPLVAATSERPAATSAWPAATSAWPAATSAWPAATRGRPAATSGRPAATSGRPAATSVLPTESAPFMQSAAQARRSARPRGSPPVELASPDDQALFARLRALRAQLAAGEGVPAFYVFHDSTLIAIALARPRDLDGLAAIRGMGPVKLARYGAAVLGVVHEGETMSGVTNQGIDEALGAEGER
jgi:ATP-dependent DNA helicase RecQ